MNKKELLNALIAVKPGIANKDIVESMTYFYFSGSNVISYNDIISIQYPIKTDFSAFIKADEFFKVISKIPSSELKLEFDGKSVKLESNKGNSAKIKTSFATINDDEVESRVDSIKKDSEEIDYKVLPNNFHESISLCSFIASKNESDQTLTTVYINKKDMWASDNRRIAYASLKKEMPEVMIKASEVRSLLNINPTVYAVTKSWIHFKNESNCLFSIRRIKGEYPDFSEFMEFDGINVDLPKEILDGVDIASIFTDSDDPTVEISLKKGIFRVFKEVQGGNADYRQKVDYTGTPVSMKINPDFLKEMLSHSTNVKIADDKAKLVSGNFTMITSLII